MVTPLALFGILGGCKLWVDETWDGDHAWTDTAAYWVNHFFIALCFGNVSDVLGVTNPIRSRRTSASTIIVTLSLESFGKNQTGWTCLTPNLLSLLQHDAVDV